MSQGSTHEASVKWNDADIGDRSGSDQNIPSLSPNSSAQVPPSHQQHSNLSGVSTEQERQILLLMLLAQVCALHDPTPRTFTVHVLELFERGILGRQSIHFLFELGLVPAPSLNLLLAAPSTPQTEDNQVGTSNFDSNGLEIVQSKSSPTVPSSTVRAQEASAIRNRLEQHEQAQSATSGWKNGKSQTSNQSPQHRTHSDPGATSWAVEHHPLSLSRYQREFEQKKLLNSGSFGEVFQATCKMDGRDYAMKRVPFSAWGYSKDSVSQVLREVHCLAHCDHPHVVRYYTSWLEPSWMTGGGVEVTSSDFSNQKFQRRLLTDIRQMVSSSSEKKSSRSTTDHLQDYFQDHRFTSRDRRFSFGSSLDADESSFGYGHGGEYSEWSAATDEDSCLFRSSEGVSRGDHKAKNDRENMETRNYRYQICLFIQMQLCHPSTLADWIRTRNTSADNSDIQNRLTTSIEIFFQIVGGLHHVHNEGIVHRDLKPANIFASNTGELSFLVGDFGLSKLVHSASHQRDSSKTHPSAPELQLNKCNDSKTWTDPLTAGVGTASYAAPEQVTSRSYGKEADIFSLGLILLELVCSFTTEHERLQHFHDCRHRRSLPDWLSKEFPSVSKTVLACTNGNPKKRPSTEELLNVHQDQLKQTCTRQHAKVEMDELRTELAQKDEKIRSFEQEMHEKNSTIEELRREVERLTKLSAMPDMMPLSSLSTDTRNTDFLIEEVASSSSSEDGI